ncbi:MAG: hypothetical protein PHD01_14605 [Geobacteraceae bacterium]|nr:hypothetical protein [Geobacteraceae bacterium]
MLRLTLDTRNQLEKHEDESSTICEVEMKIMGVCHRVQIYGRGNGSYCALTRFSKSDAIITDGPTIKEVLKQHAYRLPIAIDCRRSRKSLLPGNRLRKA